MLFDLQITRCQGWVVVAPTGELDLASAPRLRQEILPVLLGGEHRVVVDLGGIDFVDSVGAGLLVAVRKRAVALGGELRLARPEPQVARVLELAGIDRIVEVSDTVEEAVGPPAPAEGVVTDG